jgi:hypothetical protein
MRRVRRLTLAGLLLLGAFAFGVAPALAGYAVTGSFGTAGSGSGQFKEPNGVAVNDATKDVYVVDEGNNRVEWFNSTGSSFEGQFNGSGTPATSFSGPEGIAIDNSGKTKAEDPSVEDVYVEDVGNKVIDKFSATGAYEGQLTGFGTLLGIAVDPSGDLWVHEAEYTVKEYSDSGGLLETFNTFWPISSPGLAVDSNHDVYASFYGFEVLKFEPVTGNRFGPRLDVAPVSALTIDAATNNLFVDRTNGIVEYGPFGEPETPVREFGSQTLADNGGAGIAVSTAGTGYVADAVGGKVDIFNEGPTPEAPLTEAAEEVTTATAVLHGELNPKVKAQAGWYFAYNVGASCTGGQSTPIEAEAEVQAVKEHKEVTGLQPSAQYTFCFVAENAFGPTFGPPKTLTTGPVPPKVDGESTSSITPFAATLEAQLNANNETTTYAFEYADRESKLGTAEATVLKGTGPLEGYGDRTPAINTGNVLAPSTTYFYRVTAESNQTKIEEKPVQGAIQSFTTLPALAPIIEAGSEHATSIGPRTATFEANINPDFQETSVVFEYATTEPALLAGEGTKVPAAPLSPVGEAQPVSRLAEGLTPATTYFLRVTATNATGTTRSTPPVTFTTLVVPLVEETLPEATEITPHTAVITNITINPQFEEPVEPGEEPTYYILYGETEAYGQVIPAPTHEKAGYGLTGHTVPAIALYGLKPATTYHYAIVAHNPNGTTISADHQFTTQAAPPFTTPPVIGSSSAQFTSENSTVIEGEINAEGLQSTYDVQYGTSTAYGSSTPGPTALAPFTSAQGTITALTGLAPGTTYHYRIVASNGAGTGYGPDATFTTTGAPRTSAFTSFTIPTVPLIAATPAVFPAEGPVVAGTTPKALTRAQKLAKALKACGKQAKRKRAGCKAKARKQYGPSKKKK